MDDRLGVESGAHLCVTGVGPGGTDTSCLPSAPETRMTCGKEITLLERRAVVPEHRVDLRESPRKWIRSAPSIGRPRGGGRIIASRRHVASLASDCHRSAWRTSGGCRVPQ